MQIHKYISADGAPLAVLATPAGRRGKGLASFQTSLAGSWVEDKISLFSRPEGKIPKYQTKYKRLKY